MGCKEEVYTKESLNHTSRSGKSEKGQKEMKQRGKSKNGDRRKNLGPKAQRVKTEGLGDLETGTRTLKSLHESKTNQLLLWRKQKKMKGREERRWTEEREREGRDGIRDGF